MTDILLIFKNKLKMGIFSNILGGITAGIGAASAAAQIGSSVRGRNKQRQHEIEMFNLQQNSNRENWRLENMYNSPANQMRLLKEAGLNPNLAYGNFGDMTGGNIQGANPTVSDQSQTISNAIGNAGKLSTTSLLDVFDLKLKSAQTDKLKEEALTQSTLRNLQVAQTNLQNLLSNQKELEISLGKDTYNTKVQEAQLTVEKLSADITNVEANTNLTVQKILTEVTTREQMTAQIQSIIDNNKRENLKNPYVLKKMAEEIINIAQDTLNKKAQIGLIDSQISNIEYDSAVKEMTHYLQTLDADIYTSSKIGLPILDKVVNILTKVLSSGTKK